MSAIEQRARTLLATEFEARGLVESARELRSGASLTSMEPGFAASVAAIVAALTPVDGWVSPDDLLEAQDRAFYDGMSKCACPVPDGFVLVPVEPTEEMLKVGYSWMMGRIVMRSLYDELLAARPEAP